MTALDLFLQLTAGGCTLSRLDGDRLQIRDPQHILTDALRQAIRTHKAALLAMLTPEVRIPLPRYPAPCWRCKGPSERQGLRYLLCPQCQEQEDHRAQCTECA
jgi:Zn finger protein HypA/HybF involved in hydrogenase expression